MTSRSGRNDCTAAAETPPELARAQRQLAVCQWLIPALTGGILVLTAVHGEQQRPGQQASGTFSKPGQWLCAAA